MLDAIHTPKVFSFNSLPAKQAFTVVVQNIFLNLLKQQAPFLVKNLFTAKSVNFFFARFGLVRILGAGQNLEVSTNKN